MLGRGTHDAPPRLLTQFMYSILSPASRHSSNVALTLAWISLSALDWFWRSRRRRILQACHIASEPMWVLGSMAMPGDCAYHCSRSCCSRDTESSSSAWANVPETSMTPDKRVRISACLYETLWTKSMLYFLSVLHSATRFAAVRAKRMMRRWRPYDASMDSHCHCQ